ncbi:ABC transporter permease [Flavitalea antarctica]
MPLSFGLGYVVIFETTVMFRNYIKIAWRHLARTLGYSVLNILGLAIGMSVALLIGLWVYHQFSYDRFLPDTDRLYRVQRNFSNNGDTLTFRTTSLRLAEELRNTIPDIEYVAESDWMGPHGLMVGDKKVYLRGGQVGTDFLKMFQFPMIKGTATTVFQDAYSIVLAESTAKALFGDEDPMGKMVRYDNIDNLRVTGIMKDLPANSNFNFTFLVPFTYLDQTKPFIKARRTGSYSNNANQIFVKLKPGVSLAMVAPKIVNIEHTETGNTNAMNSFVKLQPIDRWHLYSNFVNGQDTEGFVEYVRMFGLIGALVLIIACINFINLTTARSGERAREVGVRKVMGSRKSDLVLQFLFESFVQTLIAFGLALVIVQLVLQPFNELAETTVQIPAGNVYFWILLLAFVSFTALIAGSRPAFVLASFKPIKVLKGISSMGTKGSLPRKVMFVFQFTASIALIISTFIIYQQIHHAKSRDTGFDLSNVMMTDLSQDLRKNFPALKNELLQKGLVSFVTSASSVATNVSWHSDLDYFPGKVGNETVEMGTLIVTEDYFKTLGMRFKEGRDFTSGLDTTSVILNEAAVSILRLKNPLNQVIRWDNKEFQIAGVVKDALVISPFAGADPTMFFCSPNPSSNMMYRLKPGQDAQKVLAELNTIFNKYNPAFPYIYEFQDESYAAKFKIELLIGKLSGIFASLAIFISCLGLFGLSAYIVSNKTKEIGIRKVLGASVPQLWMMLSRDFIGLVILSCIIASPIAYYFLHNWLQKYDYRISIGPWIFLLAGCISLIIAIVTVSFQAFKAALENPVKSIRTE